MALPLIAKPAPTDHWRRQSRPCRRHPRDAGHHRRDFREGLTPEAIQQQCPSLDQPNVYAAVGHYFHHRHEVEVYLGKQACHREEVRREAETRFDPTRIRDRPAAWC